MTVDSFNLRVFISSTFQDLKEYRQAAWGAIQSLGAHGDDMIFWSADERSGAVHSVERVKQCDVLLLLLAHRYGYVPEGSVHSITELEYHAARSAGIPVLAFLIDESVPWPVDQVEWEKKEQLQLFKRRIEAEVTRKLFRSPEELALRTDPVISAILGTASRDHKAATAVYRPDGASEFQSFSKESTEHRMSSWRNRRWASSSAPR